MKKEQSSSAETEINKAQKRFYDTLNPNSIRRTFQQNAADYPSLISTGGVYYGQAVPGSQTYTANSLLGT